MPDSGEIDNALVARLSSDAALMALVPDGVYFDEAPQGKRNFALCALVEARTPATMGAPTERRAVEDCEYIVKVVMLNGSNANARQAAAIIDRLLEDQPLTITGFTWLACERVRRIRDLEVDTVDASIRWQHRGGYYRIVAAPGGTT